MVVRRIKICNTEGCGKEVKYKNHIVCDACRYRRGKRKAWDGIMPSCENHPDLTLEECYLWNGKYRCNLCRNLKRREKRIEKNAVEWRRNYQLKKKYNMTSDDYEILLRKQNYVCAICKDVEKSIVNNMKNGEVKFRRLAVDHCAITSKIRGLLCIKCNSMIGSSKHNPEILRAGAIYLET